MQLATLPIALAIAITLGTACSSKPDKAQEPPPAIAESPPTPPAATPPVAPAPSAAPTAPPPTAPSSIPSDFPRDCVEYANLIDKLKACDKLGGARDGLTASYDSLRASWDSIPVAQRAALNDQCKTQADSLRNVTAATCSL